MRKWHLLLGATVTAISALVMAACSLANAPDEPQGATECANGKLEPPIEMCDDGALAGGDGCDATCLIEVGYTCSGEPSACEPLCGDGLVVAPVEGCDDGATAAGDGCDGSCAVEPGYVCSGVPSVCAPECGDGIVTAPDEPCDDGNTTAADGCDGSCVVEAGFTCSGEPSGCQGICGDGLVKGAEGCDDQDTQSGDGCSAGCTVEPGFVCSGVPSVCLPDTICGNCVVGPSEQCDDGNGVDLDGCRSDCTRSPVVVGVVGTNAAAQITQALDALGEPYSQVTGFPASGTGGVLLTSIDGNSGTPPDYTAALFGGAHVAIFGGDAVPSFTSWVGNYLTTDGTAQWLDSSGCTPQWSTVGTSTITSLLPPTYDFPIQAATFHMLHFMDAQPNAGVVIGRTCDRQTNAGIMATRRFANAGTFTFAALQLGVNCSGACRTDFLQPLLAGYLTHVRSCSN
ncbi:MAG: DUF4215 domain-containing protein [Myxococcales bacterium]|nr:DUF4215 domain-containing protein [Myxococcales bacterium]